MTQPIIKLKNISYKLENTLILNNISGAIDTGTMTSFIGPSGSGKSTLFRLLNGLKTANSGHIYIQNKSIDTFDPIELRQLVGIVLQEAIMIKGTVYDNLSIPTQLKDETLSEEKAKELLTLVNLDPSILMQDARTLSGGQKQKVSIARTLVNQPTILLLDEITSSLDPVSQKAIESLVKDLHSRLGLTILWITHSIEQAKEVSESIWIMKDGQVIEKSTSHELEQTTNQDVLSFIKGENQ
ncbi:phosphate ABC transporter ATP-binding protein, PhoT family [Pelagirhabdus alkalitolerans]|uniref:Phosphate ABC transporter ATP-binding protein, PhoT family n=1 Tax=Pelagirhabdus alkalitolerans TaxID=1612202 RepID=A0A1G6KMF5_9BACI|nr:ATP-binding cassette domain-containing protein [Pelagirhabdus alkalitolerans]SDC32230.1 phosphate ABC transporter ATP-binding protein, PhoT family [Pelagirhabdus alkalitolerans]